MDSQKNAYMINGYGFLGFKLNFSKYTTLEMKGHIGMGKN